MSEAIPVPTPGPKTDPSPGPRVVIYLTGWCPYCTRAKQLLKSKGVEFEEIDVDARPEARTEMTARSGRRTVPQIFIGRDACRRL